MKIRIAWCMFVILAIWRAQAATYYVAPPPAGNDGNSGADWTTALATISNGVRLAGSGAGNVVLVSNGLYVLSAVITVNYGTIIRSYNNGTVDPANTIVSGGGVTNCFYLNHTSAVLEGLTITNGYVVGNGGGIYLTYGMATNCLILNNSAVTVGAAGSGAGGGVFLGAGSVVDCTIRGNYAFRSNLFAGGVGGGGAGVYLNGNGRVQDCLIADNLSTGSYCWGGGGIFIQAGGVVDHCVLSNNVATNTWFGGGGFHANQGGAARVTGCTIVANTANQGGGGGMLRGSGFVADCMISNNYGGSSGCGGILMDGAPMLRNSTIVNNRNVSGSLAAGITGMDTPGTVDTCQVSGNINSSAGPGGVYFYANTVANRVMVKNSTISENSPYGFYSSKGGIFSNCFVYGNYPSGGGRLYQGGLMVNCIISNNLNTNGGGIAGVALDSGGTLRNCLVADNVATGVDVRVGGVSAISTIISNGAITACTIVNNRTYSTTPASYLAGGILVNKTNIITGCIIYSNYCSSGGVPVPNADILNRVNDDCTNFLYYCCSSFVLPAANHNTTNNPQFVDVTGGNYRLASGSPCIDTGTNETWMTGSVDLDGRPRLDRFTGIADMGAYEYLKPGIMFIGR